MPRSCCSNDLNAAFKPFGASCGGASARAGARDYLATELAAVGLAEPSPGEPVADEWWRVTDGDQVAGYGWLDTEWGDARITFVVAPGRRGHGVGAFILERLEDEAAARGLNYIYNVVPGTHPDGAWIRNWLSTHGFHESSRGQLRRQVSVTSA